MCSYGSRLETRMNLQSFRYWVTSTIRWSNGPQQPCPIWRLRHDSRLAKRVARNTFSHSSRSLERSMATTIVTRAPTRIDFGGGWTDVPPYSDEVGGFVCNVAIARYATARSHCRRATTNGDAATDGDRGRSLIAAAAARRFRVERRADQRRRAIFPSARDSADRRPSASRRSRRSRALRGQRMSPTAIAELSREIEIGDLGIAGGRQDHYAAAYGGALGLRFSAGGIDVRRDSAERRVARRARAPLHHHLHGPEPHLGRHDHRGDATRIAQREPRVLVRAAAHARDSPRRWRRARGAATSIALAALVGEQWTHQRSLHPAIPTPLIDDIIAHATARRRRRRQSARRIRRRMRARHGARAIASMRSRSGRAARRDCFRSRIDDDGVERCA